MWGGQDYRLASRDNRSGSDTFTFGYGGYQEARGNDGNTMCGSTATLCSCSICVDTNSCAVPGRYNGEKYYVSGILEELDVPGEWYHDVLERKLYYFPVSASTPDTTFDASTEVVAAQLSTVIRVGGAAGGADPAASGIWSPPAAGIVLEGLTITETRTTTLDRYEVPSGGDWAVARLAALVLENAEDITVKRCVFDQVGGNAVLLSNHVANSTIEDCEFDHMGDSGVVSLGSAHCEFRSIYPARETSNAVLL